MDRGHIKEPPMALLNDAVAAVRRQMGIVAPAKVRPAEKPKRTPAKAPKKRR